MERDSNSQTPLKVLHLEVTRSAEDRLKASLSSRTLMNRDTLQAYEEAYVSLENVTRRSQQLLRTLNKANRNGRLSSKLLQSLKASGQLLRDELLPSKLKAKLNTSDAHYLTISLDEQLVHVPWELLHDGTRFLCRRFAVGRLVQTRQDIQTPCERPRQGSLRMLILADLDGSLAAARREGMEIRDLIESIPGDIRVMMRSANVDLDFLKTKLRSYDWVHFAGHAEYEGSSKGQTGWRLSDGWFTAEEAAKMAGTGTMPKLLFANACQSARTNPSPWNYTRQKKLFGLVSAFLFSGTRHYIGTSWEIPDQPAGQFAHAFYRCLTAGRSVGDAVRHAREELIRSYGEEQIIWASYMTYGDPTHRYVVETGAEKALPQDEIPRHHIISPVNTTRAAEKMVMGEAQSLPLANGKKKAVSICLCVIIAAMFGAAAMFHYGTKNYGEMQQQAMTAYQTGDFDRVLEICGPPASQTTPTVNCLLLRAKVLFVQGELETAATLYRLAGEAPRATAMESSEAYIGLGRIASTRGREKVALAFYQQAAEKAPKRKDPFVAMAILNERNGNDQQAMALLDIAKRLAPPDDPSIDIIQHSLSIRAALGNDANRIALINGLIDELANTPHEDPPATSDKDRIRRPIPACVMAMKSSGYSLKEGAPELLTGMIERYLQKDPTLGIVDRHLMAMTLSELKIGTSVLSDRRTRLKRGQLQAVRLMVSGRIIFKGPETQVTLRCIDTETSQVVAIISESFDNRLPLSEMARLVSDQLIQKVNHVYP